MFQDSKSNIFKFINQFNSCIDIQQIVIRDFLSVNLVEHSVQVSIEISLLMWVFTITEHLLIIGRLTESRTFFCIKVIEDGRIIV